MKVLELPHTSVVNTVDLGDEKNIHPSDKAPICERLALIAGCDVYGKGVVGRGPSIKNSSVEGRRMIIELNNADGLKTTDGAAPKGFWLAGNDKAWHPAKAEIQGATVVLESDAVEAPEACRYAFSGKPDVNLVNKADLPAYPFRTDNWEQ